MFLEWRFARGNLGLPWRYKGGHLDGNRRGANLRRRHPLAVSRVAAGDLQKLADLLRHRIPRQGACCLDLPAQPAGCNVKSVRPRRRAIFKEYPREIRRIAQGFDNGAAPADDGGEILLSRHAVAERHAQAMSAEAFDFCDFNHHRGPRWAAAVAAVMRGPDPRIHVFSTRTSKDVVGRDKPGHDDRCEAFPRVVPANAGTHGADAQFGTGAEAFFSLLRPEVMGPCVRRDDRLGACARPRPHQRAAQFRHLR
jgi:hypothetical protein